MRKWLDRLITTRGAAEYWETEAEGREEVNVPFEFVFVFGTPALYTIEILDELEVAKDFVVTMSWYFLSTPISLIIELWSYF